MDPSASSIDVQAILRNLIHGSQGVSPASGSGMSSIASSSAMGKLSSQYTAADREANHGLRKEPRDSRKKQKKIQKGPATEFKVAYIVWMSCGVRKDRAGRIKGLSKQSFPTPYELQQLPQALIKTDYINGITLDSNWTFDEVLSALRKLFPQLFGYFDLLPSANGQSHFLVCTKEQRKVLVLGDSHPNGMRLLQNRGIKKQKWAECFICLATCQPIPRQIIQFWLQEPSDLQPNVQGGLVFSLDHQLKRKGKKRAISDDDDSGVSDTGTDSQPQSEDEDIVRPSKRQCSEGGLTKFWTRSPEPLFGGVLDDEMAKEIADEIANDPDANEPEPVSTFGTSFLRPRKAKNPVVDLTDSTDDEQGTGTRPLTPNCQAGPSRKPLERMADLSFNDEESVVTHPSKFNFDDF